MQNFIYVLATVAATSSAVQITQGYTSETLEVYNPIVVLEPVVTEPVVHTSNLISSLITHNKDADEDWFIWFLAQSGLTLADIEVY